MIRSSTIRTRALPCVVAYRVAHVPVLLDVARKDLESSAARQQSGLDPLQRHWLMLLDEGQEAEVSALTATTLSADYLRRWRPWFGMPSVATRTEILRRCLPP